MSRAKQEVVTLPAPQWGVASHYNRHAATEHWTVRKVYPNGTHIVLENDAGRVKRFRSESAAWLAADKLNDGGPK